jgi:hypothetical protein
MTELKKEVARQWIREHPDSDAYRTTCRIPIEKRHPSMQDLPFTPE